MYAIDDPLGLDSCLYLYCEVLYQFWNPLQYAIDDPYEAPDPLWDHPHYGINHSLGLDSYFIFIG